MIKFVKFNNVLMVGTEVSENTIANPRMVFASQETGSVSLAPCISNPEQLTFSTFEYSYYNNDAKFAEFYLEEVERAKKMMEEPVIIDPNNSGIRIIK